MELAKNRVVYYTALYFFKNSNYVHTVLQWLPFMQFKACKRDRIEVLNK